MNSYFFRLVGSICSNQQQRHVVLEGDFWWDMGIIQSRLLITHRISQSLTNPTQTAFKES
jgi:hypothetical protein